MQASARYFLPIVIAAATVARSQAPPAFEVASLKPSPPITGDSYTINLGTIRNGELTLSNATLSDCMKFAYSLASDEQLAGPDWIRSKAVRFDIIAKAPPATPRDQLFLMLLTLLVERFRLTTHTGQRSFTHYALTVARNGPKFREVQFDSMLRPGIASHTGAITHPQITMQTLALLISRQLRETVLDRTGLKGFYDVKLQWSPETPHSSGDDLPAGPSIFTAVQEQLGLRLEGSKDPVEILVIDHADKQPVAN